ncbi:hypothetical protein B0H19DRAFT_1062565 [Mycena capillaripes]|nr:hypothetical protein B0H19DRAFT_1062565 [Mycena capillaripes]
MDEAPRLGFPSIQFTTNVYGDSYDTSVYAGLRQFHEAKGFDPDSQELARHLEYPLYQLSVGIEAPFAHEHRFIPENITVDDEDSSAEGDQIRIEEKDESEDEFENSNENQGHTVEVACSSGDSRRIMITCNGEFQSSE